MLDLDAGRRARTVLRIAAGGGSINDVNWLLSRGSQIHSKDASGERAASIAPTVKEWYDDPLHPGRRGGWATCPSDGYERELTAHRALAQAQRAVVLRRPALDAVSALGLRPLG